MVFIRLIFRVAIDYSLQSTWGGIVLYHTFVKAANGVLSGWKEPAPDRDIDGGWQEKINRWVLAFSFISQGKDCETATVAAGADESKACSTPCSEEASSNGSV